VAVRVAAGTDGYHAMLRWIGLGDVDVVSVDRCPHAGERKRDSDDRGYEALNVGIFDGPVRDEREDDCETLSVTGQVRSPEQTYVE